MVLLFMKFNVNLLVGFGNVSLKLGRCKFLFSRPMKFLRYEVFSNQRLKDMYYKLFLNLSKINSILCKQMLELALVKDSEHPFCA